MTLRAAARGYRRNCCFNVEAVAKEWLALKDWEDVTKARRLDMLTRVVFPKIGKLPVKSVTPAHILSVMNTSAKKNGLTVAAEAKRSMSGIFELAVSTLRAEADPVVWLEFDPQAGHEQAGHRSALVISPAS